MDHFISAVRESVKQQNWYSALTTALILPDICGKLEDPNAKSQARYEKFWNVYLKPIYTAKIGHERKEHVFLSGGDAYALRCAFLHEGSDDISEQRAQEVLSKFDFTEPPKNGGQVHCNQGGDGLQLQVDIFCEEICGAVERWRKTIKDNAEIFARITSMAQIAVADTKEMFLQMRDHA
jgi:hypothetical protein